MRRILQEEKGKEYYFEDETKLEEEEERMNSWRRNFYWEKNIEKKRS